MIDKDVIIERLLQQNQLQAEQIQLLRQENQTLHDRIARFEKDSSNSSKPPSSDIINPKPPTPKGRKCKRGGQFGHKKHHRQPFTSEKIDETIIYELPPDEIRRKPLTPLNETESALQKVDLPAKFYTVMDHRVRFYQMPNRAIIKAKLPKVIRKEGLFTSSMTAFVGDLKARCHTSYSTVAGVFSDIMELEISQSYLVKCCNAKLSPSLIPAYSEALEYIRTAPTA